jgi:hypothetical protein
MAEAFDMDVVPIAETADEKLQRPPPSRAVGDDPHIRHGPERPASEIRRYVPTQFSEARRRVARRLSSQLLGGPTRFCSGYSPHLSKGR